MRALSDYNCILSANSNIISKNLKEDKLEKVIEAVKASKLLYNKTFGSIV